MSDSPPDDDDGRTVIPLLGRKTTRRGVLGAAAAMLGSSLFVRAHDGSGDHTVGADTATVGSRWKPNLHELDQAGSLRELVIGRFPADYPEVSRTPALHICLDGEWRMDMGGATNPPSTDTLLTNVASIDVAADWINVGGTDAPALQVARNGSPALAIVLDGAPSTRSSVGGGCQEFNVGATSSDLPASPPEPALQWAQAGDWEVWA